MHNVVSTSASQTNLATESKLKLLSVKWVASKLNNTPQKLKFIQIIGVFIAFMMFVVIGLYAAHLKNIQQVISHDTVPSIIAAEKLRYQLANAHAELVNIFLLKQVDGKSDLQKKSWIAYKESIRKAQSSYLDAAQNITYGEAERKPIYDVMTGLNEYERLVGSANASGKFGVEIKEADKIMQEIILPAAIALDQANYNVLDLQYKHFVNTKFIYMSGFVLFFIFVSAYLYFSQKYLFTKTKRKFNLGMLCASGVTIFGFIAVLILTHNTNKALDVSKNDAFDSVHLMWKAKATGSEINFIESLYLLEYEDKNKQNFLLNEFTKKSQTEMKYLLDENNNITFKGEDLQAKNALKYFQSYMKIDQKIRLYESSNRHADAINLCLGTKEGESNYVFDQFDLALDNILNINNTEFSSNTKKALNNIYMIDFLGLLMAIVFSLSVFLGLKPRIEEYKY